VPNSRNLPAEFSEQRYPIMVERLALRADSGGAGKRRGGFGYDKRIRSLRDCLLLSNADRSELAPYGVNGGLAGAPYGISVVREDGSTQQLPGMVDDVAIREGDEVRLWTSGGGGWGDPLDREVDLVRYDVLCELVSVQAARSDYGVVIDTSTSPISVDEQQTKLLREQLRQERGAVPMFDRGGYFRRVKNEGGLTWPPGWSDPDNCTATASQPTWRIPRSGIH
jgi:N-methylhydantoinase B